MIFLSLFIAVALRAKECGPPPPGATFSQNCKIIPFAPPALQNASSTDAHLVISLENGNESEKRAKLLLEEFARKYALAKYFFTTRIRIQSFIVPHSHPILTLNTRTIDEPDRYLALFIHEQVHWFFGLDGRPEKLKSFVKKMQKRFPKVPTRKEGGAEDEESTYLHFAICFYEFEILAKLIGNERAEQVFKTEEVYPWIRQQVLKNKAFIRNVLRETQLQWQDAGSASQ